MSSSFDVYVRRNTWLYCLDPRVKLAFVFVAVDADVPVAKPAVARRRQPGLARAAAARRRAAQIASLSFLRGILVLLLLVLVLTTLFTAGGSTVWFSLGPLRVTAEGFWQRGSC